MKKVFFIILIITFLASCKKAYYCSPDWMQSFPDKSGQSVINMNGDTIFFTDLNNYSYFREDLDLLLQSDSVIIKFTTKKNVTYDTQKNMNKLVFDSTTYMYSSANGSKYGNITNYIPQRDLLRYFDDTCKGFIKSTFVGCSSEYEICNNFEGYKIILTHKERQYRGEVFSQKLNFLVYKEGKLIKKKNIVNYNNIQYGYIQFFTSDNTVFLYHFNNDKKNKNGERILAKFSFNELIK